MNFKTGLAAAALAMAVAAPIVAAGQNPDHVVTQEIMDRWKTEYSNWGRWGKDDQKGTLNLITDKKRREAAALVKDGTAISLARDIVTVPTPPPPAPGAATARGPGGPQQRMLSGPPQRMTGSTDSLTISAHGYTLTHFDAFGHHLLDGKMYNGFPWQETISMEKGLAKGSVISAKDGFFTRGILVDMPLLKGVRYLEPGTAIYVEDLEAWEKKAGIKIKSGDAVFIRTGRWEREAAVGPWNIGQNSAGLDASVIPWLRKRDVALLGSESALSVVPFPKTTTITNEDDYLPVHNFALVALGMNLVDSADLGPLAEAAAKRKRWEFLVNFAPIRVVTGTGVPINPIAIF